MWSSYNQISRCITVDVQDRPSKPYIFVHDMNHPIPDSNLIRIREINYKETAEEIDFTSGVQIGTNI